MKLKAQIDNLSDKLSGLTVCARPVTVTRLTAHVFLTTDKKVRQNTGLPNKSTLNSLFELLKPKAERMRYWAGAKRFTGMMYKRKFERTPQKSGPKRQLSCKAEFVLTLMKLQLGLTNAVLCDIF